MPKIRQFPAACTLLLAVLTHGWTFAAVAASVQSVEALRAAVTAYLEANAPRVQGRVRVEVGAIDPRLQLPACTSVPEAFAPNDARKTGNVTVGVRCAAPAWSVYLPARVEVLETIVVATRALPRGAVVTAEDVVLAERDVTAQAGGYFTATGTVVGKVVRRPVVSGAALTSHLLQEARVVRRGDRITLLARTAGIEVRMEGEALEEGGRGEEIRARNLHSKREVRGVVTGPGTVEVRL